MPKRSTRNRPLRSCAPALAVLVFAAPALAERSYYAWQTEEGSYAFSDDAKAIPEAYRARAERRTLRPLAGYAQLTPADARATEEYAKRLDARLEQLRALSAARPADERPARAERQAAGPTVALRTGGRGSPLIELGPLAAEGDEPVIVETLRAHPADRLVTRNNVVVRQGERTLTIVRSRGREWNVNEDIHVEDDLE